MHLGTQYKTTEGEFNQEGGAEFTLCINTPIIKPHLSTDRQIKQTVGEIDRWLDRQITDQWKLFGEMGGNFSPAEENMKS